MWRKRDREEEEETASALVSNTRSIIALVAAQIPFVAIAPVLEPKHRQAHLALRWFVVWVELLAAAAAAAAKRQEREPKEAALVSNRRCAFNHRIRGWGMRLCCSCCYFYD